MKSAFIIAAIFVAFGSSSALAGHVVTSNQSAIHCSKNKSDKPQQTVTAQAARASAHKAQSAK